MEGISTKIALVVIFAFAALFYSVKSILKFQEGKISISTHRQPSEGNVIEYPSVTICSGFRDGRYTPLNIARDHQNFTGDSREILGLDKVQALSYERTEYLSYFTQAIDNDWLNNLLHEDDLWTESFHEHFGGRCATFNPTNRTKPGEINAIIFGIQWPERSYTFRCDVFSKEDCFYYFAIFLHPKDGFIYNKGTKFIGQSMIYPTNGAKATYTLEKKTTKMLNKDFESCDKDVSIIDWKKCIWESFDNTSECILPWHAKDDDDSSKICTINETLHRMESIEHHTWWDVDSVLDRTNCTKPCNYDTYQLEKLPYAHPLIPGNWVFNEETAAVVTFYYADTVTEITEEYLAYDGFSLFGEMGGALGLFLGLSMVDFFTVILRRIQGKVLRSKANPPSMPPTWNSKK